MVVVDPLLDGVLAYVISNDMLKSQADCAASNEMELVHMSAGAFAQFDDGGYWALAGMVHEVKHVSSFYKRMRSWYRTRVEPVWHPVWVEEGTAEIATEMSSRLAWESVGGPPADARLTGEMFQTGREEAYAEHFGIFELMARTVLAFSADPNAVTFEPWDDGQVYGSGWHFHRFLRDWFAGAGSSFADDQAFVTALNDSMAHSGAAGIERVVGEPISEILAAHAVAMTVAGAEASLTSDDTPRFTTVDFPTATEIFLSYPDPPGIYPWPVTTTGEDDDSAVLAAPLAQSATFRGHMGESGLRVHDFRAEAAGAAAVFRGGAAAPDAAGDRPNSRSRAARLTGRRLGPASSAHAGGKRPVPAAASAQRRLPQHRLQGFHQPVRLRFAEDQRGLDLEDVAVGSVGTGENSHLAGPVSPRRRTLRGRVRGSPDRERTPRPGRVPGPARRRPPAGERPVVAARPGAGRRCCGRAPASPGREPRPGPRGRRRTTPGCRQRC